MLRILIGHLDADLPAYDTSRYDARVVRYGRDGQRPPQTIAEMRAQCPADWTPDVYYHASLVHFPIPRDIEDFDGLTATNIQDWHRGGRAVWAGAGFFDLIATERNAQALLQASGYEHALFARFWGVNPALHRVLPPEEGIERDIDVLFIGSLNAEVWAERNRWLDRLALLSGRIKVVLAIGHYGENYVRLTNRAKIVFNRSVNGCTNQRAYDAPACGALVFNETENDEVREAFEEDVHCVYYSEDDFADKLEFYLTHEAERQRIAEAGRALVLERHTETAHTNALFALLEANVNLRYRPNATLPSKERAQRKILQMYSSSQPLAVESALTLLQEIEQADEQDEISGGEQSRLWETKAALHGWFAHYAAPPDKIKILTEAIGHAKQAVRANRRNALAQMGLGFLLLERAEATQGAHPTGRNDIAEAAVALSTAAEQCEIDLGFREPPVPRDKDKAREAQADAEDDPLAHIEGLGYPRWSDLFDVRMERAYLLRDVDEAEWATEARRTIAWRCRSLLSDLAFANGQAEEAFRQAEVAHFDLPEESEALLRLARCEATTGKLLEAIEHYRDGLAIAPFHYAAWPELVALLNAVGLRDEAEAFATERLQVLQAIPAFAAIRPALLAALNTETESTHSEDTRPAD